MSVIIAMLFLFLGMASTIFWIGPIIMIAGLAIIMGRFVRPQSWEMTVINLFLFIVSGAVISADILSGTEMVAVYGLCLITYFLIYNSSNNKELGQ